MTSPVAPPPYVPPYAVPSPAERLPRRPIFGWIGFGMILLAAVVAGVVVFYAYAETQDAFIQGPPWWALTSQLAALPVGILCLLGLVLGIVGAARREKPGWPAIAAMIFALPGLGYVAVAAFVWFTVTVSCSTPPGACGI